MSLTYAATMNTGSGFKNNYVEHVCGTHLHASKSVVCGRFNYMYSTPTRYCGAAILWNNNIDTIVYYIPDGLQNICHLDYYF